jgi:hypothetical protein
MTVIAASLPVVVTAFGVEASGVRIGKRGNNEQCAACNEPAGNPQRLHAETFVRADIIS